MWANLIDETSSDFVSIEAFGCKPWNNTVPMIGAGMALPASAAPCQLPVLPRVSASVAPTYLTCVKNPPVPDAVSAFVEAFHLEKNCHHDITYLRWRLAMQFLTQLWLLMKSSIQWTLEWQHLQIRSQFEVPVAIGVTDRGMRTPLFLVYSKEKGREDEEKFHTPTFRSKATPLLVVLLNQI
jgi:hypothetical protein